MVHFSYVCVFIHTRASGSNDTTTLTRKVLYSTLVMHSSKSPVMMTQSRVAHRSKVPPGQPDHLSTRGPYHSTMYVHTLRTCFTATLRLGSCTGQACRAGPWAGPGFNDILRAGPGAGLKLAGRARAGK